MINIFEVNETNKMIDQENLDVRTITMGISLLDCVDADIDVVCEKVYAKITTLAKNLVKTGEDISAEESSVKKAQIYLVSYILTLSARSIVAPAEAAEYIAEYISEA